jgi:hypothetical protein
MYQMDTSFILAFFSQRVFTPAALLFAVIMTVCCEASLSIVFKVIDLLGVEKRHGLSVFSSTFHC